MIIYIAEKQILGLKIAKALGSERVNNGYIKGNGYAVYFCSGHLLEQKLPEEINSQWKDWEIDDLPMLPKKWQMKPIKSKIKYLKLIVQGLKKAKVVVHVGDPDRAGQRIIDEVLEYANWKGITKRLWLKEQSQKYINKNINNLEDNKKYYYLSMQALARSRTDWLIGLNAIFSYEGNQYEAILVKKIQKVYKIESFENKKIAIESYSIANNEPFIKSIESKDIKQRQPLCFEKSDLVFECYKKYKFNGDKVLKIAQKLYAEHDLISYPRTDCNYLPEQLHCESPKIIHKLSQLPKFRNLTEKCNFNIKSPVWNDEKLGSHDAIYPLDTLNEEKYNALDDDEKKVYEIIATRFISQFYNEQYTQESTIITSVDNELFLSKGTIIKDIGWSELYPDKTKKMKKIPALEENKTVKLVKKNIREIKKTAPLYFNDGNIEKAMKNIKLVSNNKDLQAILKDSDGIGETSTRATIIKNLKKRKLIVNKTSNLVSTPKGRMLIDTIIGDIKDPYITAVMERDLSKIKDLKDVENYINQQKLYIIQLVDDAKKSNFEYFKNLDERVKCPKCSNGRLTKQKNKQTKQIFFSCSEYITGCNASYQALGDKPYIELYKCQCKKGMLKIINTDNNEFFQCNACKIKLNIKKNKPEYSTIKNN